MRTDHPAPLPRFDTSSDDAADDPLSAPRTHGELRRLTIMFADLVDSTVLSTRVEPEAYRLVVGRYRERVMAVVNAFDGHVLSTKGDGLLSVFGYPRAHEHDACRAVAAALKITGEVTRLGEQVRHRFGVDVNVRIGVHRGLVYLDTAQDDVYGLAANLAARVSALARPGTVVVSDAVAPLIHNAFELRERPATAVKGVDGLITHHEVCRERLAPAVRNGPLVGRHREVAQLQDRWARAHAGSLATPGLVIRGEIGIGKSRVSAKAIALAEGSGGVVLKLSGSPLDADTALHPVRRLIEQRCGIDPRTDPARRRELLETEVAAGGMNAATLVPLLAPPLKSCGGAGVTPTTVRRDQFDASVADAVRSYLLASIGDGAGLIVAENVHWFDASTMDVLGSLLGTADPRLLVVMTARPDTRLPADWPVEVLDLHPLTDQQADELIGVLHPGLPAAKRKAIASRCDGVPLYIKQVVAHLSGGQAADTAGPHVPDALYEALLAKLPACPRVVAVAEAAATIGRCVDGGLLRSVVSLADADFDNAVRQLQNVLIFEPWGSDGWRFHHELLREVAVELAPPSVRRKLHAKVADCLSATGREPDWSLVAAHYEQAERFAEAARAKELASTRAPAMVGSGRAAPGIRRRNDSTRSPRRSRIRTTSQLSADGLRQAWQTCSAGAAGLPARMGRWHARNTG
jgi:class 3 adenylate cyclase